MSQQHHWNAASSSDPWSPPHQSEVVPYDLSVASFQDQGQWRASSPSLATSEHRYLDGDGQYPSTGPRYSSFDYRYRTPTPQTSDVDAFDAAFPGAKQWLDKMACALAIQVELQYFPQASKGAAFVPDAATAVTRVIRDALKGFADRLVNPWTITCRSSKNVSIQSPVFEDTGTSDRKAWPDEIFAVVSRLSALDTTNSNSKVTLKATPTKGYLVHARPFNSEQVFRTEHLKKIALMVILLEADIDKVHPPSRQGQKPSYQALNSISTWGNRPQLNVKLRSRRDIWNTINQQSSNEAIISLMNDGKDRNACRWKVNLGGERGTIVYRQHMSTFDARRAAGWARFVAELTRAAGDLDQSRLESLLSDTKPTLVREFLQLDLGEGRMFLDAFYEN